MNLTRRSALSAALLPFVGAARTRKMKPALGAARRPFPDTRSRIRVFTDQLPTRLTDAQMRFISTHYVGTQKMPRSWTRQIRRLNPNFLVLHYQLAVGTGPAAFLHGEQWVNDFKDLTAHEDWFLHNAQGKRLHQTDWDWYVMDLRFNGDRPRTRFPDYWLRSALRRMRDNENDGTFADSYTQDILMNQLQPPHPWFQSAEECWKNWLPHLNRYGAYCAAGFHRQPERFYYLPNLGGLVTTWDRYTDYGVGDGGMNEGFCTPAPGNYYSEDDWKLQMSRLLSLASQKKILLCQTSVRADDLDHRWFVVGSYLLSKGPRSYLNMIDKSTFEWYPEYALDLGAYTEAPGQDVSTYWSPEWRVFRRDYEKGIVLVNPSASPVALPAHGKYRRAHVEGGGAVGPEGKEPGRLITDSITSLTIPAHSARVLLF